MDSHFALQKTPALISVAVSTCKYYVYARALHHVTCTVKAMSNLIKLFLLACEPNHAGNDVKLSGLIRLTWLPHAKTVRYFRLKLKTETGSSADFHFSKLFTTDLTFSFFRST